MPREMSQIKVGYPGLGARMQSARRSVTPMISQDTMGKALSLSWVTVHRWEMDARTPTYGMLERFGEECGKPIEYFLPTANHVCAGNQTYTLAISGEGAEKFRDTMIELGLGEAA